MPSLSNVVFLLALFSATEAKRSRDQEMLDSNMQEENGWGVGVLGHYAPYATKVGMGMGSRAIRLAKQVAKQYTAEKVTIKCNVDAKETKNWKAISVKVLAAENLGDPQYRIGNITNAPKLSPYVDVTYGENVNNCTEQAKLGENSSKVYTMLGKIVFPYTGQHKIDFKVSDDRSHQGKNPEITTPKGAANWAFGYLNKKILNTNGKNPEIGSASIPCIEEGTKEIRLTRGLGYGLTRWSGQIKAAVGKLKVHVDILDYDDENTCRLVEDDR